MDYTTQYQEFLQDKNKFFTGLANNKLFNTKEVRRGSAFPCDYQFLATNRILIEEEFNQLFSSLKASRNKREEFWLYCYYLAILLESFYKAYGQAENAAYYNKIRRQIWHHCKKTFLPTHPRNNDTAIKKLSKRVVRDLKDVAAAPIKIALVRQQVVFYNLLRASIIYSRMILTSSLHWLEGSALLLAIEKLLQHAIDIKQIIKRLDSTVKIFRPLSVAFFLSRFFLHASAIYKHVGHPSEVEKGLAIQKRLYLELYKRHVDMIRDGIWSIVNGLSNYSHLLHIPLKVAGGLTAVFLMLDIGLVIWSGYLARREYLIKKSQYLDERRRYLRKLENISDSDEQILLAQKCQLLNAQLEALEISWKVKKYAMWFNITAGLLLAIGFTASLLLTAPFIAITCYLVCLTAMSMCLSNNEYCRYTEKGLQLEKGKINNHNTATLKKEYHQARTNFMLAMVKYTVIPALFIATFAVCWQASLVLLALYLGYELYCAAIANRSANLPAKFPPIQPKPHSDEDVQEEGEEEEVRQPTLH